MGCDLEPPWEAAQIGLCTREILCRQVHSGQHSSYSGAGLRTWIGEFFALKPGHEGRRFSGEGAQNPPLVVRHRIGAGNSSQCEMTHEFQIERQLLRVQALEQSQNEALLFALAFGCNPVIGVLDSGHDALKGHQMTHIEPLKPGLEF